MRTKLILTRFEILQKLNNRKCSRNSDVQIIEQVKTQLILTRLEIRRALFLPGRLISKIVWLFWNKRDVSDWLKYFTKFTDVT